MSSKMAKGNVSINNALKCNALITSKCSKQCMALCEPHPGHFNPVRTRKGHFGNRILSAGLNKK